MSPLRATAWVDGSFRGRQDVLPAPLIAGMRVLTGQGIRQGYLAVACFEVLLVERFGLAQLTLERLVQYLR